MLLEKDKPQVVVLDLDGVITDTRRLHFNAWKEVFDNFLKSSPRSQPFSENDYENFVDGKPREEGIKSFMNSRYISLPNEKIHELGLKKNHLYKNLLQREGPSVFDDALEAIKRWKFNGYFVAVISSSKNGKSILKAANLYNLMDACVDGEEGEKFKLKGKPEPDYLLEAAHRVGLGPDQCILVEDSLAGIVAGKKANFKEVIGISRTGQTPSVKLYENGADVVVKSLLEIDEIPHAINSWEDMKARIGKRDVALFIDFDGTISDIVPDPKDAAINESIKEILINCSKSLRIAIISGRDRFDVQDRVGIDNLFYVGCHGLEMSGPGCFSYQMEEAEKYLSDLQQATLAISSQLSSIKGIIVERKKYSTSIHYRMVLDVDENFIKNKIHNVLIGFPQLKIKPGKMVFELYPNLEWGKGEALRKLCQILDINPAHTIPIYLGDDLTDEDAFKELHHRGIGIKVSYSEKVTTQADYWLKDPVEVGQFLSLIESSFTGENKRWRVGL